MSAPIPRRLRRLPAGALLLVLTVSIIVAAILLALVLLTSNRRWLVQRDTRQQAVQRNLFSGLAYAQAHTELAYFQPRTLDLFGEGNDSVTLVRKPWGVFDVATVTATRGALADTVVALLGSQFTAANQAALYLADARIPLSVNGDAQVRGGGFLPQADPAREANLPLTGAPRTGAAVTGTVRASAAQLPVGGDSTLARLRAYAGLQLAAWLPAGSQTSGDFRSRQVSFRGPATVLYRAEPITLQELTLSGQVVVASARRLTVAASARLDNVLLLAPVVVLQAGFRGRVQIIARDTVDIQAGCDLMYPSAVCAYSPTRPARVDLGPGSRLSGVVLVAQGTESALPSTFRMGAGAAVQGQIFSAGTVENCGLVHGTLMCRRLVYRTSATFYDNYLVNTTLDRTALPPAFLTTPLLNPGASTGVVAWLR